MMETFAFVQNFNKLQDILGRSRAVASGKKVSTVCVLHELYLLADVIYVYCVLPTREPHISAWLSLQHIG